MLRKQFRGSGDTVSMCVGNVIIVASAMIFHWPQIERINAMGCPCPLCVAILLDNGFAPEWGKGITVPIVRSVKYLIHQFGWVDAQSPQHVEGVLDLWGKPVPQLEGEITIGCCQGSNERRLEGLNCPFGGVNTMVMWFDNLQLAVILGEKFFDVPHHLIIHDV
jgi:hypothetical protein